MLQAKSIDGRLITPATYSRESLNELKATNQPFICPVCEKKVILRAGEKVIAHFAHTVKANCPSASGGEGPYHEQGKLLLYQWLLSQGLDVWLETYLREINQRPDLFIHLNGKKIAIEYQCAKVPANQIIERTKGYNEAGIHVIWIIGAKRLKRVTSDILKLDSYSQIFIHRFSSDDPHTMFFFCPLTSAFIKFQDISFLSKNRAAGKLTVYPLAKINLKHLFIPEVIPIKSLKAVWKREKRLFRLKRRDRLYGKELAWHQWLYLKRMHLEQLPSYVHLPVKGEYLMKSPSWVWQSRLIYDVICPLKIGSEFSIGKCFNLLRYDMNDLKKFPLIKSESNPVHEYLQLLVCIGILTETSKFSFKKIKPIELHRDVQTAVEADVRLIEQLFSSSRPKYKHEGRLFRYTKY